MAPKKKIESSIAPPKMGVLEELQDKLEKFERLANVRISAQVDILEDIVKRLDVLEAHVEKEAAVLMQMEERLAQRDEVIRMLREHTLRLVREKENLLMHLGMRRQNELNQPDKVET